MIWGTHIQSHIDEFNSIIIDAKFLMLKLMTRIELFCWLSRCPPLTNTLKEIMLYKYHETLNTLKEIMLYKYHETLTYEDIKSIYCHKKILTLMSMLRTRLRVSL